MAAQRLHLRSESQKVCAVCHLRKGNVKLNPSLEISVPLMANSTGFQHT